MNFYAWMLQLIPVSNWIILQIYLQMINTIAEVIIRITFHLAADLASILIKAFRVGVWNSMITISKHIAYYVLQILKTYYARKHKQDNYSCPLNWFWLTRKKVKSIIIALYVRPKISAEFQPILEILCVYLCIVKVWI